MSYSRVILSSGAYFDDSTHSVSVTFTWYSFQSSPDAAPTRFIIQAACFHSISDRHSLLKRDNPLNPTSPLRYRYLPTLRIHHFVPQTSKRGVTCVCLGASPFKRTLGSLWRGGIQTVVIEESLVEVTTWKTSVCSMMCTEMTMI